jgi:hypothetical protein
MTPRFAALAARSMPGMRLGLGRTGLRFGARRRPGGMLRLCLCLRPHLGGRLNLGGAPVQRLGLLSP